MWPQVFSECSVAMAHAVFTAGQLVSWALSELHSAVKALCWGHQLTKGSGADIKYAWGLCASKHIQADRQTLCRLVQCVMMMLMMIASAFGREKVCMCIYSLWAENNGKGGDICASCSHTTQWHYHRLSSTRTIHSKHTSSIRHDSWINALNLLWEMKWRW